MALDPSYAFYSEGTISLVNGSDIATGEFVAWDPAVLPFDFVVPNNGTSGLSVVEEVLAMDQIRLAAPWSGPTLTDVPYFMVRWTKHTDPKVYALRLSDYLTRLKAIPENLEEIGQQVADDAAAVAAALATITQAASDVEADRAAADVARQGAETARNAAQTAQAAAEAAAQAAQAGTVADGAVTDVKVATNAGISSTKLSFLQSGADAVTRTVSAKLREFFSVKDFGAVGDGATNDWQAVQRTINYVAGLNGGVVYFPPGIYAIGTNTLTIPNKVNGFSGITLQGSGQGCELKKIGTAHPILTILGARCAVRDLTTNGKSLALSGITLSTQWDGQPTLIENVAVVSTINQGIYNAAGDSVIIRGCYFLNCGPWAIEALDNMMNTTISGCTMQGSGGIHLIGTTQQAEGLRIIDNTIMPTAGSGVGVDVEKGMEILIANNIIDQVKDGAVRIRNNASYVKVIDNWLAGGVTYPTLDVTQNANSITVSGNTFEGGTRDHLALSAAALGNIHSVVVSNNIFNNVGAGRIGMAFTRVRWATVFGNIVRGPGAESIFWTAGEKSVIANNIFWKGPNIDATATQVNNLGW